MLDWEKLEPKRIQKLEKENADLRKQLSFSDLIIAEYEGRVLAL